MRQRRLNVKRVALRKGRIVVRTKAQDVLSVKSEFLNHEWTVGTAASYSGVLIRCELEENGCAGCCFRATGLCNGVKCRSDTRNDKQDVIYRAYKQIDGCVRDKLKIKAIASLVNEMAKGYCGEESL